MYSDILAATDGSDPARRAVRAAVDLAAEHHATLHLLAVVDERVCCTPALGTAELSTAEAADRFEQALREGRELAEASGVSVESTLAFGDPVEEIQEHAAAIDADLVVLGEHGDHQARVGGVGRQVAAESDRSIRIVEAEG